MAQPVTLIKEIEARYFVDTLFSKETKKHYSASLYFINDARGKSKPKAMTESSKK
jgi:3-hydroxyacyl-CoA dehydrogenase/enoyl-CoA hydratase/3-hydroxybutyryl-CoA epimerase